VSTGEAEIEVRADARPELPAGRRTLYYGWVMLPVAIAGVIAISPGQTFGIAAFNESIRSALELTHSQLSGAYMVGTLLAALPLAYLDRLMDRHGLRRTTAVVIVFLGMACVVAASAQNLAWLAVAFFLLRLLGPGAMSLLKSGGLQRLSRFF
jgi:MFS transporter, OFA family, oxalate/formate antiporter